MEPQTQWTPPAPPAPLTETAGAVAPPRPPYEQKRRTLRERIFGPIIVAGALLLKFGKVGLLFATKAKFLATSGSMLVSVAAYALIWGWTFAVGFVALLFVHEMGHYIQLRREGVKPSGMLFIPFLGAVVGTRSLGGSALAEARVGLAGPILGTVGSGVCLVIAEATNSDLFRALAYIGFFLNLFNLLPVVPLDGGRAMAAMAPWMWFVGLAAMAALAIAFPNPIILIILLLAAFSTWQRWKARRAGGEESEAYYRIRPAQRAAVAIVYIGLIAALVVGMDVTHVVRTFADA
ncbi:MAG TPA: site-2 protease family protein [Conexibacter sp.]|nr:site-2 protease family protein [Conexibacter sp.]